MPSSASRSSPPAASSAASQCASAWRWPRAALAARAASGASRRIASRVARAARVVHEPGEVGVAGLLERAQHLAVELAAAHGRDPLLDREPRQVVAERERLAAQLQQAGVDARVDRGRGAA